MTRNNVKETAPAKPIARKSVLEAVRKAAAAAGAGRLTLDRFLAGSGLRQCDVFRYYSRWNEVLQAAGCDVLKEPIKTEQLLADWGGVARKLKGVPSLKSYELHGKYNASTLGHRFGAWSKVCGAFREFAARKKDWADVMKMIESAHLETRYGRGYRRMGAEGGAPSRSRGRKWVTTRQRRKDEVSFGAPLNLFALRYEPVNENGVIYLFGILAERLGFSTEAVRAAFPDCIAKRQVGEKDWRNVRIEFEYESRNFREHGHDPEGCDMIVCWNHNWAECPPGLEVVALSEEIRKVESESGK